MAAHESADSEALLDWNESPIGPPPLAVKRVIDAAERLHRYPRGLMISRSCRGSPLGLHYAPALLVHLGVGVGAAVVEIAQRGLSTTTVRRVLASMTTCVVTEYR